MADLAIEVNPERAHFRKELFTSWRSTPAVDICESEQDLVILIDLPGVDPDGLEIEVTGNILSVLGKASRDEGEGRAILREYETHDYFRAFIVTEELDTHGLVSFACQTGFSESFCRRLIRRYPEEFRYPLRNNFAGTLRLQ